VEAPSYPWYQLVTGSELQQGDILLEVPRFVFPPETLQVVGQAFQTGEGLEPPATFSSQVAGGDAIILTQSCDLAIRATGRSRARDVMLCPLYTKVAYEQAGDQKYSKDSWWEEVRTGKHVYHHALNKCSLPGLEIDFMVVDLGDAFTLSVELVRSFATARSPRARLLPPYREHLAQAFARLFMRVGLPTDIPPFGKKKS